MTALSNTVPSVSCGWTSSTPWSTTGSTPEDVLDNSGNRRKPEIQVVGQQSDGIRSGKCPERRARHQVPPYRVSPCTFETCFEVRREVAVDPALSEKRPLPAAQERQAMARDERGSKWKRGAYS